MLVWCVACAPVAPVDSSIRFERIVREVCAANGRGHASAVQTLTPNVHCVGERVFVLQTRQEQDATRILVSERRDGENRFYPGIRIESPCRGAQAMVGYGTGRIAVWSCNMFHIEPVGSFAGPDGGNWRASEPENLSDPEVRSAICEGFCRGVIGRPAAPASWRDWNAATVSTESDRILYGMLTVPGRLGLVCDEYAVCGKPERPICVARFDPGTDEDPATAYRAECHETCACDTTLLDATDHSVRLRAWDSMSGDEGRVVVIPFE